MLTEEEYSNEYDLDGIRSKKVSVVTKYNINSGSGGGTVLSGGDSIQAVVKPPINQPEKKLISKTTKTHTYLTQNGKVMRDTLNTTVLQTKITRKTEILDFIYDETGRPFALIYTNGAADPVTYYYVLNLQGDVVALTDSTGAIVVEYAYNAWGKVLTSTTMPECATPNLASINPLRYRGYYYDTETKFYYLQSRYYDPANHRFINADSYASTDSTDAIACNMFAYCCNSPVCFSDERATLPNYCLMIADTGEYTYFPPIKETGEGTVEYKNSVGTKKTFKYNYSVTQVYDVREEKSRGDISQIDNLVSGVSMISERELTLWGKKLEDMGNGRYGAIFSFTEYGYDDERRLISKKVTVRINIYSIFCRAVSHRSTIKESVQGLSYEIDGMIQSGANGGALIGFGFESGNPWIAALK